jgi:hypothetical protein
MVAEGGDKIVWQWLQEMAKERWRQILSFRMPCRRGPREKRFIVLTTLTG